MNNPEALTELDRFSLRTLANVADVHTDVHTDIALTSCTGCSMDCAALEKELAPAWWDQPPGALYHYTTGEGFKSILETKTLLASHYRFLNDRSEFRIGEDAARKAFKAAVDQFGERTAAVALLKSAEEWYPDFGLTKVAEPFVVSFSRQVNQLSQWRAYGDSGAGYCLGFRSLPLPKDDENPDVALALVKCEYQEERFIQTVRERVVTIVQRFEEELATLNDREVMKDLLMCIMQIVYQNVGAFVPRLKHFGFAEEEEWRLIVTPYPDRLRPQPKESVDDRLIRFDGRAAGLRPRIAIPLADNDELCPLESVWIGPTQDPARARWATEQFLQQLGYDTAIVRESGIPLQ